MSTRCQYNGGKINNSNFDKLKVRTPRFGEAGNKIARKIELSVLTAKID
jgi:hypothetical protein